MRTCFVPFCDVKNKDQPNRTMFLVPKEPKLFALWSDALPKVRQLKTTDKVCYVHFRPDEVLNTFDHCINGQIIKIKRDRSRLKPDAVPCLQMTTKKEWLSHRAKSHTSNHIKNAKSIAKTQQIFELNLKEPQPDNDSLNIYIELDKGNGQDDISSNTFNLENNVAECESHEQGITEHFTCEIEEILAGETNYDCNEKLSLTNELSNEDLSLTELTSLFNLLYENVDAVLRPNTLWGIHRCPQGSCICFSYMDVYKMLATKMVLIKDDGIVQLLIDGNIIKTLQLLRDIDGLDSLSILLNKMDVGHLCFGKLTNTNCDLIVEPNNENCWLTDGNEKVYLCKFCLQKNEATIQ